MMVQYYKILICIVCIQGTIAACEESNVSRLQKSSDSLSSSREALKQSSEDLAKKKNNYARVAIYFDSPCGPWKTHNWSYAIKPIAPDVDYWPR